MVYILWYSFRLTHGDELEPLAIRQTTKINHAKHVDYYSGFGMAKIVEEIIKNGYKVQNKNVIA